MNHPGTFTFNLIREVFQGINRNAAVSPFSMWIILSLLRFGARDDTKQVLEHVLFINDEVSSVYNELSKGLSSSKIVCNLSNSIWSPFSITEEFKKSAQLFETQIETLNFGDTDMVIKRINQVVSEQTNDLIPKIIDSLPSNCAMVLVNTIYFKAPWLDRFTPLESTWTKLNNEEELKKKFITASSRNSFSIEDELATFLFVPLADGDTYMTFILPRENTEEGLNALSDPQFMNKYFSSTADFSQIQIKKSFSVQIPEFNVSFKIEANDLLSNLGLDLIFDKSANFLDLIQKDVHVDQVIHKVVVKVNQYGVEAAAATSVSMRMCSMPMNMEQFVVDRPFLFVIWNHKFKIPLFVGKIIEP